MVRARGWRRHSIEVFLLYFRGGCDIKATGRPFSSTAHSTALSTRLALTIRGMRHANSTSEISNNYKCDYRNIKNERND